MAIVAQGQGGRGSWVLSPAAGQSIFDFGFWHLEFPGFSVDDVQLRAVIANFTESPLPQGLTPAVIETWECWTNHTEVPLGTMNTNDGSVLGIYITENAQLADLNPNWILHGF